MQCRSVVHTTLCNRLKYGGLPLYPACGVERGDGGAVSLELAVWRGQKCFLRAWRGQPPVPRAVQPMANATVTNRYVSAEWNASWA